MLKTKHFLFALIGIASLSIMACGGGGDDTPPTPQEQRLIDLASGSTGLIWTATSATFEGQPSTDFDGMTLTLKTGASETYSSTNGDPVFNSSGTWGLNGENVAQLIFDGNTDNVFEVTAFNAAATPPTLTLRVNFTDPGGTIDGTNGTYIFNFTGN